MQVRDGRLRFRPVLLGADEFLRAPRLWSPLGPDCRLDAGTLGFTYCGVPVIYRLGRSSPSLVVTAGGRVTDVDGDELDAVTSALLFGRTGAITSIEAAVELWPHRSAVPPAAAAGTSTGSP